MADTLYPIQSLPPAGPISTGDLLLIKQGPVDRKLGIQALIQYLNQVLGAVGDTGPSGATAYQVAVANGFVGTEAAWLASLTGAPGYGNQEVFAQPVDPVVSWPALNSVAGYFPAHPEILTLKGFVP